MVKKVVFATVLALSVFSAGCFWRSDKSSGREIAYDEPPPASYPSGRIMSGSAPRAVRGRGGANLFRLPMTDGQPVTVRSPAMLFFFTSWCGYCKVVMPEFKQIAFRARQKGWRVYGIDVGEGPSKGNEVIQSFHPNFPILLDQQSLVAKQYGVEGYPTFVIIDENANIVYNSHDLPTMF